MNWIKRFFSKKVSQGCERIAISDFSIEYYPITDRYYPKYKSFYLKTGYNTGIVEVKEPYLFAYAEYGSDEIEAMKIIERFKEQRLKENVKTIPVNDYKLA